MTRMLRDRGYDFRWYDKYATNDIAKGYEYEEGDVDIITAFEVFEHLDMPNKDISWMAERHPQAVIFSTLLYKDSVPNSDWWYWCFEHGQHITFYSAKTLEYIANRYDWNYYSLSDELHIFVDKRIKISGLRKFKNLQIRRYAMELLGTALGCGNQMKSSLTMHDFYEQREKINESNE